MQEQGRAKSDYGLSAHGIRNANTVWWNLSTPALYEQAVQRHEGNVAHLGPLVTRTGQYTGRSPKDRFIVEEPTTKDLIWWGKVNHGFDPKRYEILRARLTAYLQGRDLFVQDCYTGADPDHKMPIRVVNETAWHNLFARNMFIQEPDPKKLMAHVPEYTILHAPGFLAVPEEDGTNSEAFVVLHLGRKEVIIGGTAFPVRFMCMSSAIAYGGRVLTLRRDPRQSVHDGSYVTTKNRHAGTRLDLHQTDPDFSIKMHCCLTTYRHVMSNCAPSIPYRRACRCERVISVGTDNVAIVVGQPARRSRSSRTSWSRERDRHFSRRSTITTS